MGCKKGLRVGAVFLAAAVLLSLTGCQSAPEEKKSIKIGVCAYKQNDTFISAILGNLEQLAKEYEQSEGIKVNLEMADGKESQRVQNEQFKRFVSFDYDVICVNIVDRTTAAPIIDDAIAAGIPVVFFNREPVESDIMRGERIYYVGSDAKTTAVMQGEIVAEAYKKNPETLDRNGNGTIEYFMLEGEMGHQDAIIRTEWSVRTLLEYGLSVEKLQGGVANWDRNQAAAFVEQWMHGDPEVELILCNNDDMALGAADTLEKLGLTGSIAIAGIDATPQGLEAVRDGRLLGTVDCDPPSHAKYIFEMACGLGLNGSVPAGMPLEAERYIRVPLRKITKENIDD